MQAIADLQELLLHMQPELDPGRYAFVTLPAGFPLDPAHVVASIREPEGLSVIIPEQVAVELGLPVAFTAAWITLTVHSDLSAVGLTAAFSQALAQAGISCNVVAGVCHDHLFVPVGQARAAMDVLRAAQAADGIHVSDSA
ncbi:ACT domain-containing protein [Luteimonas viscosa]|uniref:ACT domain-containing protein n=1 Tax=Luteimonas viscosa TaxID=1132694 RepID=A0A5D4XSR5_9GAMM|nr:ACT domain-containing protein [Luteimonas viscosa]TYT27013.1 ACT domain-containing protein [Luteimonas viscosa]